MRVTFVNLWHDQPTPAAQIDRDETRRELSRALAARGHAVTVVQEHPGAATVYDGPVRWIFAPPSAACRGARALLRAAGRDDAMVKAPADHLLAPVAASDPQIIHSFDLAFYPTVALLSPLARRLGAPLLLHDHGGAPARWASLRWVERRALRGVARLLFTTAARGQAWVASGALDDPGRIAEVFETSTRFSPGDPAAARARLGLAGAPLVAHLGRLDPVKDPLTTLEGFRLFLRDFPSARLALASTDAPLLAEVRAAARDLPVRFLGRLDRAQCQDLLRGADLFVQASRREVCGVAALEALATGVPPVLSDIPPFRRLTDGGAWGRLFPPGDAAGLARALGEAWAARQSGALSPEAVRAWFSSALSFEALAASVEAVYQSCLQEISVDPGSAARQSPASQSSSSA